jgi:retinol dehydrogenase-12
MAGLHPTVAVVGATGAIGSATAEVLMRRGARLLLLARPGTRLDSLVDRLQRDKRVSGVPIDLSVLSSVRSAARDIARSVGHIDALVITAAVFSSERVRTADGFELMAATNHLGPFLLANLLRDRLVAGGRVITVTAPSSTRVSLDQMLTTHEPSRHERRPPFRALRTFGATKAANLMFTFELARRAKRWDVRANAYHPGLVRSRLMQEAPRPVRLLSRLVSRGAGRAAEDLAELAVSPAFEGTTGWFFKGLRHIDPPRSTLDVELQNALWARSAALVELGAAGF